MSNANKDDGLVIRYDDSKLIEVIYDISDNHINFCDDKNIYSNYSVNDKLNGEEKKIKTESIERLKALHSEIVKAFADKYCVKFYTEILRSEDDYKKFLKNNLYRYGAYAEILTKHCAYNLDD